MSSISKFQTSLSISETITNGYDRKISELSMHGVLLQKRVCRVGPFRIVLHMLSCGSGKKDRGMESFVGVKGRLNFLLLGNQGLYTYFEDEKKEECLS